MKRRQKETKVSPLFLGIVALVALMFAMPAHAVLRTWSMVGSLTGNTVQANWQHCWADLDAYNDPLDTGAACSNPNVAAAGIAQLGAFTAVITYDDATAELSDVLGEADNPLLGTYVTGAFNWTLGSLSARTAYGNQAISYAPQTVITTPLVATLDLILFGGGSPAAFNGSSFGLEVVTIPPDPDVAGDIGTNPGMIIAGFAPTGTMGTALAPIDDQFTSAPSLASFPLQGFSITLVDTSGGASDGQVVVLSGTLTATDTSPADGQPDGLINGTQPSCASFGGDSDGDAICDDVDKCPSDYDITQFDLDNSGVGNACNDADDADGDEWETAYDNCPDYFDPTNVCAVVPVLGLPGYLAVMGLFGVTGLFFALRGRVRA